MARSQTPVLLYVLPLLAVVVLGVSIFFSAGTSDFRSALVLGGPTDGTAFRGRLQVTQESLGSTFPLEGQALIVEAIQGGHRAHREGTTDSEGWFEFELPLKSKAPFSLQVRDRKGEILAEGAPELSTERWAASARRRGGQSRAQKKGELSVLVEIDERVLAVPFESRASITVKRGGIPLAGAIVKLEGTGLKIQGPAPKTTNEEGVYRFLLAPQEHVASLNVNVAHEDESFRFEQLVPVIPGAFGFRNDKKGLRVLSPIPREEAWFTFVRGDERLAGDRIKLTANQQGGAEGVIPRSAIATGDDLYLVLASAADGRSPSTVGYPLDGQAQTFDAWDAYLIDGAVVVKAAAAKRQRKVRWTLGAYAGLSGLLTMILFFARVRRDNAELAERLEAAGATADTQETSALPLVIAVLCLFFAFSAGVLWIVAR